jgi:CheY-like chemotaxis protein
MPAKRVLIIDDEADIREVVAMALESSGDFEVVAADGGLAGLRAAFEWHPDLILLDVMMPELDGPSTFRLLRESEASRAVPVIFLTAKVQAGDRHKLAALGALGIIAKPFDPMHLAEEIGALAGWTR